MENTNDWLWLEMECKTQNWTKKVLNKPIDFVDKINTLSISSVRQKLKITVGLPTQK